MVSALDALTAVISLVEKTGLTDEIKYRLEERRKQEQRLAESIGNLPDPKPPKKGTGNG